jgi:hypothetical protein
VAEFPLAEVFAVLQTEALTFQEATVTSLEDSVALAGKVALLGAEQAGLTVMFTEADDDTITFDLSAMLPVGLVPGASWLSLEAMQIALQVVGRGSEVTGSFSGTLRSGTVVLDTQIEVSRVNGSYTLTWNIAELDVTAIVALFLDGSTLPPELPAIAFADIAATIEPSAGAFSLSANSAGAWEFPANGGGLTISQAVFSIARSVEGDGAEATSQIDANLAISGTEPLEIATDFSLSSFNLSFELAGADWQVAGDVAAVIFDESVSLAAEYTEIEGIRTFQLTSSAPGLRDLIQIEGVGSFGLTGLALVYSRPIAEAGTTPEPAEWSLAASGRMTVEEVFDFEGTLTLARTADETSLVFEPDEASVTLPLPPSGEASMVMAFAGISVVRGTAVGAARSPWVFDAAASLSFVGWHPTVQEYLPEAINASFQATNDSVRVTADRVTAPFDFDIPDIEIDEDLIVTLGNARIDVTDLAVVLGRSIQLSARIGVGLPEDLNNLFGLNEMGEPALPLFNTFDPANPEETTIQTELAISASGGIQVIPRSSILKAVEVVEENGVTFWHLNLGDFGEVKLQVPVFGYNAATSSFQTSGGFEVVRPLSIPLTPAKLLLQAVGLDPIANGLPDGIPMEPIKILDDQGNFQTEELVALLEQVTDGEFPDELGDALNAIGDQLERLPESFRQYLNVDIPDSFTFDLAVTPTGEVRLDAHVNEGDPPVRLLYPSFTPLPVPLPAMNGVELRSLSFGTLAGGSLALLQVDADLDQFDLLTLGASLLIPDLDALPLPDTRDLHRRLSLHNLFMIVVYQTGIPIPIPMFYDNLGLDYLGLEGIELETSVQFPQPSLNLAEVSRVLSQFKRFFTDRDFLLDPDDAPEDFNLRFSFPLPNNFLNLPEYLGSERLGSDDTGVEIDAYRNLAHLLNGFKTFSLNQLIQSVPLEHRVNSVDVSFGPLSAGAGWLLTTPGEFQMITQTAADRQRVYDRLGFTDDAEAEAVFAIAPVSSQPMPTQEEGLVALLRGTWSLATIAEFDAAFGLAASGAQGFSTGFRIAGDITDVLDLEIAGLVAINTPSGTPGQTDAFRLAGNTHLSLLNHQIFDGDVQILNDTFQIRGDLSLFPPASPLQVNGQWDGVISPNEIAFDGDMTVSLAGFDLVGARAMLNDQRLFLQGTWLGVTTTLDVMARDQSVLLHGDVDVDLWGLQAGLSVDIDTAQGAVVQGSISGIDILNGAFRLSGANGRRDPSIFLQVGPNQPLQAEVSGAVSLLGFTAATEISVREDQFSFQARGNAFNRFRCSVSAAGSQLNSAGNFRLSGSFETDLFDFINREATRVIGAAVDDATADLQAAERDVQDARREVNRLQREIDRQRSIIQQERAAANRNLQNAQNAVTSARNRVNSLNRDIRSRQAELRREQNRQSCTSVSGRRICVPSPNPVRVSQLGIEIAGLQTALGTATVALRGAEETLRLVQRGVNTTPINLDPRVAGLVAARETANAGLSVAEATLRTTQDAVGAFGQVSTYITQNGLANAFRVQAASFDLALSAARGNRMNLSFTVVYLGRTERLSLVFDFNDPLESAEALARELLPGA